jgi:TolB-like protein
MPPPINLSRRAALPALALAALLLLLLPWAASAQALSGAPRIAVLEFEGTGVSDAERRAVTNQLRNDLVNQWAFTVLDRARTEAVLDELAFQQQGVTDARQAARIGRLLNVESIVAGQITRLERAYQVHAQMIRVETAAVERTESIVYRGDIVGLLADGVPRLAERLAVAETAEVRKWRPTQRASVIVQRGKPTWPLWAGGVALAGALVLERSARATEGDAEARAQSARERNESALFADAQALQGEADQEHQAALALAALAAGLIAYYLFSEEPAPGTADSSRLHAPYRWQVGIAPDTAMARYTLRW